MKYILNIPFGEYPKGHVFEKGVVYVGGGGGNLNPTNSHHGAGVIYQYRETSNELTRLSDLEIAHMLHTGFISVYEEPRDHWKWDDIEKPKMWETWSFERQHGFNLAASIAAERIRELRRGLK